ncbi:hypothetical protein XOCgx_0487 [Xanthomonas oryzae pv. oryzicola]|nr:hypothetical protein XOCgx_0487 [Xanthomonas oryzae pv. oryzicola]
MNRKAAHCAAFFTPAPAMDELQTASRQLGIATRCSTSP